MIVFLKAQLSSLIATAVDFLVTIALVEVVKLNYVIATTNGALAGAVVNFMINKFWSFNQGKKEFRKQSLRYVLVWTGSIILNVFGSNLLMKVLHTSYIFSKVLVSIIVGVSFNYTLQKYYVFSTIHKTYKE